GKLTGNVEVRIAHQGGKETYTVEIVDNSYKASPITKTISPKNAKEVAVLDLSKQHGWYDFSVRVSGLNFVKTYAGRVETGQSSYTDPLMGRTL
ncbi:MAG: phospholipase domain-containing protein, partial [Edaphobacter sp.]